MAQVSKRTTSPRPNIVFILADNLGYGELGVYGGGILRGAPTPRIDKLASEGTRLLNFNVEAQCTPSRSAFITGRFSIRSGTYEVPIGGVADGLTLWEVTIAELLADMGYATGMWGKWHLGSAEERFPTNQGFDEWYGIPRTYDEAMWPSLNQTTGMWPSMGSEQGWSAALSPPSRFTRVARVRSPVRSACWIWKPVERWKPQSRTVQWHSSNETPALASRSLPTYHHRWFTCRRCHIQSSPVRQVTAIGPIASQRWTIAPGKSWMRLRKQVSRTTHWLSLPAITARKRLDPWQGDSGPWRGTYFTAMEASLRVPFIIHWTGKVPAGRVSNEIVHIVDMYTTFARICDAEIPSDRAIDGVDQSDFFLGKQENSNREGFPAFVANRLSAVKWRNWKMHLIWQENMYDPPKTLPMPKLINLLTDLKEERDVGAKNSWVAEPMMKILGEFEASMKKYPPIKVGTPNPYLPPYFPLL